MDKPVARVHDKPCLEYSEVIDFIEDKYKIKVRDYAGKFSKDKDEKWDADDSVPYLDFWHWVLDACGDQISNPCYFYLPMSAEVECPPWVREILDKIAAEFPPDEDGGLRLHCWW